jgi:hypothetical protein
LDKDNFDEPAAIENISKKAAILKKMLQATEQKMKAALNKGDSNISRSKSAEPVEKSVIFTSKRTPKVSESHKYALICLNSVYLKLNFQNCFTKLKDFVKNNSQEILKPTKQTASKDTDNNRY